MPSAFAVHCCQFFRPPTSAINCLAFDKTSKKIAVSRSDACIEIWTTSLPPCRERTLPFIENSSVEALAWCRGRLFATGLDGYLREWSLNSMWPVNLLKVTPSAAWCMASNQMESHLVIGTEEGALLLVAVTKDGVHMEKCLTRSGDRILSVAWSRDGRTIVAGSVGVIRVWDVMSGRCHSRMTVSQTQADVKTLIWSIAITDDPIIITGDSRGVTSFWDLHTSTLINSYESHTADVLSVCWSETRQRVYSSGIDPVICQYNAVKDEVVNKQKILGDTSALSSAWVTSNDSRLRYVENIRLNVHTHDVRCLIDTDEWLVSGGVDGVLTFSKYPPRVVMKFHPFNADHVSVAAKGRRLLLQYPDCLEIWRLGSTNVPIIEDDGKFLPVSKEPEKLAQVKCKSGTRILCSSIDDDGQFVAYSDGRRTNIYQIKVEEDQENPEESSVAIQPIKCLNGALPGASTLCFGSSSTVFLSDETGSVQRVEIDDVICRMETLVQPKAGTLIKKLVRNRSKPQIAAITTDNRISVIDCVEMKIIGSSAHSESLIVDVKFTSSGKHLLVLYSDGRLVEMETSKGFSTEGSVRSTVALPWRKADAEIGPSGFTMSPNGDTSRIVVFGDDKLALISRSAKNQEPSISFSDRFRHVCKVDVLDEDSMVIVQVDDDRYLADLPPALRVKKYGTG